MAEPRFSMTAEEDLPRTLRREKEAREREAQDRDAPPQSVSQPDDDYDYVEEIAYDPEGVTVTRLDISFFHLMLFFIKAAFAAIPAMIIFVAVCILIGETLQSQLPWLRQFEFELIMRPPK
ncbi:MAG: hypothetical protein AAGB04_24690 [Pseudomonadota bacterium]